MDFISVYLCDLCGEKKLTTTRDYEIKQIKNDRKSDNRENNRMCY